MLPVLSKYLIALLLQTFNVCPPCELDVYSVSFSMERIEALSPSEVIEISGSIDPKDAVYRPSRAKCVQDTAVLRILNELVSEPSTENGAIDPRIIIVWRRGNIDDTVAISPASIAICSASGRRKYLDILPLLKVLIPYIHPDDREVVKEWIQR